MTDELVHIASDRFRATFAPRHGGRLVALDWRDDNGKWLPLMPTADPPPYTGQKATAFPLIPFGGRLRGARLQTRDGKIDLPEHPAGSGLVLHGDGARRAWAVTDRGPDTLALELLWPSPDWPFAAHARMSFEAAEDRFIIRQSVNAESKTAPFALGWHPYFRADPATIIALRSEARSMLDIDGLAQPFHDHRDDVALKLKDISPTRSYRLRHPSITLIDRTRSFSLAIDVTPPLDFVTLHAPLDQRSIAIEPVTHVMTDQRIPNVTGAGSMSAEIVICVGAIPASFS